MIYSVDVVVIGAGAAGLMAAAEASKRGLKVCLIEHTSKIGEKIRISGGGRCNFTNLNAAPENYISRNPHFMKSALSQYTQHDFIKLVKAYKIDFHEKTLGQLFCDGSAKQIINMLLNECRHVDIRTNCTVNSLTKKDDFILETTAGTMTAKSVVIATGGLSIPRMGATDFGYKIARQFGIKVLSTQPALVPLTVDGNIKETFASLSGVSQPAIVSYKNRHFKENILFTHRGLSGPAILQISSYMEKFSKEHITMNLLPEIDLKDEFMLHKDSKQPVSKFLKQYLPNRFIDVMLPESDHSLTDMKKDTLFQIADSIHKFKANIDGSEGYQKAEVTVGGVDTNELSSKTMMSKKVPQLFFVGEVVDVTGWLGGYNFQWAWSSGYVAGQNILAEH
ncbi:MAG: aminoacetone oxidase family FAD-binding enzyme [Alphaproteobacteria bacterium CG_4_10_14_0_8_um_filter_37_21]|nr:MAG: aminoacetone oxidase family FAD-binding enzyme [Alphaproteobacteria bacterium CG_4_10_14_0_8_um_filter_37_21]